MEEVVKETNSLYFTVNGIAAIAFSKDCKCIFLLLSFQPKCFLLFVYKLFNFSQTDAAISIKEGCLVEIYEVTNIKDVNDWKYVCGLKDVRSPSALSNLSSTPKLFPWSNGAMRPT
jgi:hypothetical protein